MLAWQRFGCLAVALLVAGCATPAVPDRADIALAQEERDRVVIAIIDSGSSPYLPIFTEDGFAPPVEAISLKLSDAERIEQAFEEDEAMWASLEARQLYWYEGTRLLGISFFDEAPSTGRTIDNARHGSKTTYLAAREAPDAIVVSVQIDWMYCEDRVECGFQEDVIEALEWVAAQPWIDIVSFSGGIIGHPPDTPWADATAERFAAATEEAARNGKLVFVASGNVPVPPFAGPTAGPPWTIAVGGFDHNASGASVLAAPVVDVVANFSDHVPDRFGEYSQDLGTSLATPIVAGTIARALDIVRASGGTADAAQLRAALNASAVYTAPTDWSPTPPRDIDEALAASAPVLLQPQMGWGYVDASLAPEIARRVLEDDLAPPSEKQQAVVFQAEWQRAREEYWSRYG